MYAQGEDEPNGLFGTTLAPGIHAHYHQHIFSMRVEPTVDGLQNESVVETDMLPLPNAPTGSAADHAGNAFIARGTPIARAADDGRDYDGGRDYDYAPDRRSAIVNPTRLHARRQSAQRGTRAWARAPRRR